MRKPLICVDRDGTLIYDTRAHLYLGSDSDWMSKIGVLPYVIDGLKLLKNIPGAAIYIITNQPGVAISDFPLLTLHRAHRVSQYLVEMLNKAGARIDGYFLCPHANPEYVEEHTRFHFDTNFVGEYDCIKPRPGMVLKALKAENIKPENANVYMIGDRASDVETALNINGFGVLVPFENQPGEDERVRRLGDQKHVQIAENFFDAAAIIVKRERSF